MGIKRTKDYFRFTPVFYGGYLAPGLIRLARYPALAGVLDGSDCWVIAACWQFYLQSSGGKFEFTLRNCS